MSERGQTAHDFLIGTSVLLLVLFAVFGLVPQLYQPFTEPVEADEETMADSLAERLVDDHRLAGASNTLDYAALANDVTDESELRDRAQAAGVLDRKPVNVTLLDGDRRVLAGGSEYHPNSSVAATAIRVVRFDGTRCTPTCRLVVRVWS